MTRARIAGVCFGIAITAAAAAAEQPRVERRESTRRVLDVNGRWLVTEKIVTTRSAANGQDEVVVDTYQPNPAAPGEPMRVVRRLVTVVRQVAPDRWVTERTLFEPDTNGRLSPVGSEQEESTGR